MPNRYFIQLPGISLLRSESNLATSGVAGHDSLTDLRLNMTFNPNASNTRVPELYAGLLNEGVQFTMQHQTATNRWRRFVDAIDRRLHPGRMVYRATASDRELRRWQQVNCGHPA